MALERANPLPPGWYWVDVPREKTGDFNAWLALKRQSGQVRVKETRETFGGAVASYLFEVIRPTRWYGPGLPTRATAETRLDDTVQRPEPETAPLFDLGKMFDGVSPLLLIGALYLLSTRR